MAPCLRGMVSRAIRPRRIPPTLLHPFQLPPKALSSRSLFSPPPPSPQVFPGHSFGGRPIGTNQRRGFSSTARVCANATDPATSVLPVCCPGCGAYAQTVDSNELGYYGKNRLHKLAKGQWTLETGEEDVGSKDVENTEDPTAEAQQTSDVNNEDAETIRDLKAEGEAAAETIEQVLRVSKEKDKPPTPKHRILLEDAATTAGRYLEASSSHVPVCDRCHDLVHHNKAISAPSPTISSIREFLNESPYKENHVYHVVDAADFPMSVIPKIHRALSLKEQRSRNRRAPEDKYRRGRKLPTISFIVTRSDLLAATKEQVDSKMEYMRTVLRDALGKSAQDTRLGNVHMISAHRGWWTKNIKDEIKKRGQGIWVVGKANVGKSSFIEACFPKDSRNLEKIAELVERRRQEGLDVEHQKHTPMLDTDGLLPPAPREDLYPVLPVVSSLPGTTVSPIRIPFGRGKGEMIDLPGLDRGQLEDYVRDEHKREFTMAKRPKPERLTIKGGQSLLLGGGLVRITAVNPDDVLMAACFVPFETHLTRTDKAIEMQAENRPYPEKNVAKEGFSEVIQSAGTFDLKWDVTRSHLPTHIAKAVEDRKTTPPPLPYKVMSADILIEGCGWVELTMQIRAKSVSDDGEPTRSFPQVEVFSPNGQHIGSRMPIECWEFVAQKKTSEKRKLGARGRQNIGQQKRVR